MTLILFKIPSICINYSAPVWTGRQRRSPRQIRCKNAKPQWSSMVDKFLEWLIWVSANPGNQFATGCRGEQASEAAEASKCLIFQREWGNGETVAPNASLPFCTVCTKMLSRTLPHCAAVPHHFNLASRNFQKVSFRPLGSLRSGEKPHNLLYVAKPADMFELRE